MKIPKLTEKQIKEIRVAREQFQYFEMLLEKGGYIKYEKKTDTIIIQDYDYDTIKIDANELIKFTNTNFWKYLSEQVIKE